MFKQKEAKNQPRTKSKPNPWNDLIKLNLNRRNDENLSNFINILKQMQSDKVPMTLSNHELVANINFIIRYKSVEYYEIFEILLDYVQLTDLIAYKLIENIYYNPKTANNDKQQSIQFEIYKKLIQFQSVKDFIKDNFYFVIISLNIQLVDFVIKDLKININRLFNGRTVFQCIVGYLVNHPDKNFNSAYNMFGHLLMIGADILLRDEYGNDIYFYIKQITDQNIQMKLNEIISNHQTSKY